MGADIFGCEGSRQELAPAMSQGPIPMSAERLKRMRAKLATIHDLDELRAFRDGLTNQGLLGDPIRGEIQARMTALYAASTGKGLRA